MNVNLKGLVAAITKSLRRTKQTSDNISAAALEQLHKDLCDLLNGRMDRVTFAARYNIQLDACK